MADRRGSYLSDENIRKMCPQHFAPPASKTYQLFQTPAAARGYRAQRPNRPYKMMEMMAKQQGIPYNALLAKFQSSIPEISNEGIAVISPKPNLKNVAQPQPLQSRAILVPTGSGQGKLKSEDGTEILSLVSRSGYGSSSSSVPLNPIQGLGNLGSLAQQLFNGLDRSDRVMFYQQLFLDAENSGVDFKGTGLSYSAVARVPGGLNAQSRLFGELESSIYQVLGMTQGQAYIDRWMQDLGLMPEPEMQQGQAEAQLLPSPPEGEAGPSSPRRGARIEEMQQDPENLELAGGRPPI